jgi:hypothetical protein
MIFGVIKLDINVVGMDIVMKLLKKILNKYINHTRNSLVSTQDENNITLEYLISIRLPREGG